MFFSYDHEDGIEFHDTAEQAKARAESALDGDRDYADDGWTEEVIWICWGEVKQRVCETSRRKVEPEEGKDYEEEVDYGLRDTDNAHALPEPLGDRQERVVGNSGGVQ